MDIFKDLIDNLQNLGKPQLLLGGFALFCYSLLQLENEKNQSSTVSNSTEDDDSETN